MSATDAQATIPAEGWYPDPWSAPQQRYWNGEWTAWTVQPAPRRLGALDLFGVTVAFITSLAGFVVFCAGLYPPAFTHPALSIAGAITGLCGMTLSGFALHRLGNAEGNRHELLWKLARAGVILPAATATLVVVVGMLAAPT